MPLLQRGLVSRKLSTDADAMEDARTPVVDLKAAERFGSASPWASDPWEAATAPVEESGSAEHESLLATESFGIPMSAMEEEAMPSVGTILGAYEGQLQRRSARHLGYPCMHSGSKPGADSSVAAHPLLEYLPRDSRVCVYRQP